MTLYKSIKKSKLEIRGGTIFITIPQEIFNLEKGPYFDEHGHKFELGLPAHMSFRLDGTIPEWYIETVTVEVKGIHNDSEIGSYIGRSNELAM